MKFVCSSCSTLFDKPPVTAFFAPLYIQGHPYQIAFGITPAMWDNANGPMICPMCVTQIMAKFFLFVASSSPELLLRMKSKGVNVDEQQHIQISKVEP